MGENCKMHECPFTQKCMNNENVSLLRSTDPNSPMSKTFFHFMFLTATPSEEYYGGELVI